MSHTYIRDRLCFLLARVLFPFVLAAARMRRLLIRDATAPGKRRILVLSDHRLGDTVHQVPLFEALRRAFPADRNHLAVFVRPPLADLVRKMPWFDEVIPGDALERHPILWLLHGHLWRASARRFEMLIDPVRLRVVGHDWLNILWRPAHSVAYESRNNLRLFPFIGNWQRRHGDRLWSQLIPASDGGMIVDDFQTFVDAAAGHGTKVDESAIWTLPMPPSESSEFDMVLAPGANTPYRRWPLESFRSLVERLLRAHPFFRFAVVGGREESPLGQSLADAFPGQMTNLCGKTDILGLAAILSPNGGQRIVVANETGTAHLAAVQGTRTIVILGGGDFGALFPSPHRPNVRALFKKRDCFGCGWQCRYADLNSTVAPCVEDIRVEDVVSAIEEWL